MLISYIVLCKCCFHVVRNCIFLQLQPLCCPSHSKFLHNLMHLQTPSFCFRWQTTRVSHANQIAIEGLVFLASLIALKSSDIDVILGMDWLSRQNAYLDCKGT